MRLFIFGFLVLLALTGDLKAQGLTITGCQPNNLVPQAAPCPAPATTQTGAAISITNTFQVVLASATVAAPRSACVLQNTGSNNMWVYFKKTGASAATKTASLLIQPGQFIYCQNAAGQVLQEEIDITGTATDTFAISYQ